ncbi:unnamed protein product [Urochloa humidicola]
MGCAGSKQEGGADDVAAADVVYRPPATSVSLFDISAVEEPWLIAKKNNKAAGDDDDGLSEDEEEEETTDDDKSEEEEEEEEKPPAAGKTVVPLPLLEKLEGYELAPASWSEVSKALEDMKPHVLGADAAAAPPPPAPPKKKKKKEKKKIKKKKTKKQKHKEQEQQQQPQQQEPLLAPPSAAADRTPELAGRRVVKDNPFLMRDRESKQAAGGGAPTRWKRRDPFEGCPERRPPGATGGGVVLYTTTLHGVRRTFDDCERARELVEACAEAAGVAAVDERDVSLHAQYLRELRELTGDAAAAPPRLFVMGRYVGGADECAALADSGKLREMMRWAKARGDACCAAIKDGRGCEGCGGARFVPCWECGGSCKVVAAAGHAVERCAKCNENGLMMCPICH